MESISVALCTYNGEEFLPKQLDSIKQQTCQVHELIVCDDGSRDATLTILEKFKDSVPFPVHIHQNSSNLGSSKNFEQCLQKCSGEIIFLCDQDDVWMPNKVEIMRAIPTSAFKTRIGTIMKPTRLNAPTRHIFFATSPVTRISCLIIIESSI
jgi:glycosyltransferase involved in cell wall biosynthesis